LKSSPLSSLPPNPDDLPLFAVSRGLSVERKLWPVFFIPGQIEVLPLRRGVDALNSELPRRQVIIPSPIGGPSVAKDGATLVLDGLAGRCRAYGSIAGQVLIRTENHMLSHATSPGSGSAEMVGRTSTKAPDI
jgi:hypothetical protein